MTPSTGLLSLLLIVNDKSQPACRARPEEETRKCLQIDEKLHPQSTDAIRCVIFPIIKEENFRNGGNYITPPEFNFSLKFVSVFANLLQQWPWTE
jgi:hypothetical protein